MASPKGPGGRGPQQFLRFLKVKAYVGPTIILLTHGAITIGPHQFQKRNYTPAIVWANLVCMYLKEEAFQRRIKNEN